jgi:hypothetical protein
MTLKKSADITVNPLTQEEYITVFTKCTRGSLTLRLVPKNVLEYEETSTSASRNPLVGGSHSFFALL